GVSNPQRQQPAHRLRHHHAEADDERELQIPVKREQDQKNQERGQWQDDLHLFPRRKILFVFSTPIEFVTDGKLHRGPDLLPCFTNGASQVAAFHTELDSDEPCIGFPVNEGSAAFHLDIAELRKRQI